MAYINWGNITFELIGRLTSKHTQKRKDIEVAIKNYQCIIKY